jgi:hypothetical protein
MNIPWVRIWKHAGSGRQQQMTAEAKLRRPDLAGFVLTADEAQQLAEASVRFTRERSQVRNPPRPSKNTLKGAGL